jgi:hypothetical protein
MSAEPLFNLFPIRQSSYRNVVDRNERDVIFGFRCVLAQDSTKK